MNRKNKFRVWFKSENEFIDYWCGNTNDTLNELFESERYVFSQYTRKKDKNDKEIYDGDLVQNSQGRICEVYWFEPAACWDCKVVKSVDGDSSLDFTPQYWHNLEVIGNIYDNPELSEL